MKIRVYYEDTDAGGIVYHTNYIKYCERARSELFFANGMMPAESSDSGFVVRDIKASFLATASLGDMVDVTTTLLSMRASSIVLNQSIYRGDIKLFDMEILLVYVRRGKAVRVPAVYRDFFEAI
ncbi:4-hydroxybenzoyl-CoA thioesterase family active site [hydrothermal vent metagenome]|uniref:4-hydroxybenzoyl-CoA thioesterase family active site n=1 Tax=hydrothermal vent metagenome TaxID=652676 RepID=A0A1W1C8M2_9ZZZZ